MENTNFIPANQLPEAEGDEVSVLCVENGELKQKSASGLGGGGHIMKPTEEEILSHEDAEGGFILEITANYDELAKVLEAGGSAYVRFPATFVMPDAANMPFDYVIVGIHSWAYSPAGKMSDAAMLICCGHMSFAGMQTNEFIMNFVNGTYIPNLE